MIRKILRCFAILLLIGIYTPLAPLHAIDVSIGDGELIICWVAPTKNEDGTALTDLLGYYIYRAEGLSEEFVRINEEPVREVCYADNGLTNGVKYTYAVTAVDFAGNESKKSPSLTAVPNIQAPSKFRAKPGDSAVYIFWEPYIKSELRGYHIYRKSALESEFTKITALPLNPNDSHFIDSGLNNGLPYFYIIRCLGINGLMGLPSQEAAATPMAVIPSELSSINLKYIQTYEGDRYVEVTWDDSKDPNIAGYNIYRRQPFEIIFKKLNTIPIKDTYFKDITPEPDRIYLYSVVGITEKGMETQYPKECRCFTAPVYISSFSHDLRKKALKTGDRVCFYLRGEPGGTAYCEINGLFTAPFTLEEMEDGLYIGCIDIKEGMTIHGGHAVGILEDKNGSRRLIKAEGMLTIDNLPPEPVKNPRVEVQPGGIKIFWDLPDGEYTSFEIFREEVIGEHLAVVEKSLTILPGDVTSYFDIDTGPDRSYFYTIFTIDGAGNKSVPSKTKRGEIKSQSGIPLIEGVKDNTGALPQMTGNKIEVELIGERGCRASFFIENLINSPATEPINMPESTPGIYRGSYIVKAEDKTNQGIIVAYLMDDLGYVNSSIVRANLLINPEIKGKKPPKIKTVRHNAFDTAGFSGHLVPGETIVASLETEHACKCCFTILPVNTAPDNEYFSSTQLPFGLCEMVEDGSRNEDFSYKGQYTIAWKDPSLERAYLWVCVSDWAGNKIWQVSDEYFSIDTRPRIKVEPQDRILLANQASETRIRISLTNANGDPVENHHIALTLTTTGEYTGVIGGGDFGNSINNAFFGIDFDNTTDFWGELETFYKSGFAAKTALIIAKDLTTGHAGVGYILNFIEAQTNIYLIPYDKTRQRLSFDNNYKFVLTAEPDRLTADGVSTSWITAKIVDKSGKPQALEGIPVIFHIEADTGIGRDKYGNLWPVKTYTDSSGQANTRYTAGTVLGVTTISARHDQSSSKEAFYIESGMVDIQLMSDAPAKIKIVADPNYIIADGSNRTQIKVWVRDINDNPVQQAMVEFFVHPQAIENPYEEGFSAMFKREPGRLSDKTRATDRDGFTSTPFTSPRISGALTQIDTVFAKITSKIPEDDEIASALGTIFVPLLHSEMEEDEEVKIIQWLIDKNDYLKEGEPVIKIEFRNKESYIKAPVSGKLINIKLYRGEKAKLGQTLGNIQARDEYMFEDAF